MSDTQTRTVTLKEASSLLGVSDATIRNWVKSGYLNTVTSTSFQIDEINKLKKDFDAGKSERLNSRANKRNSTLQFIPDEYISETSVTQALQQILKIVEDKKLERERTLFAISLLLLEQANLLKLSEDLKYTDNSASKNIIEVLSGWSSNKNYILDEYTHLRKIDLPTNCDFLGLVYQSLYEEGAKAQTGSYYTPKTLVEEIVNETVFGDDYVLDPCCGTGQFLLSASKK